MVFTYLLIKLLDLGYRGIDGMWSVCCFCINLAKSSDEIGGLLSLNMYMGGCIVR